jgi:hypothetical protein
LVDVVPGLAELADTCRVEDVAAVEGYIGGETDVPDQIESFLTGGTHSVTANFLAVTGIITAGPLRKGEASDAGGAGTGSSDIAIDGS